jgi:DnaJ family protein C protein 3
MGDAGKAVLDIHALAKLIPDNTNAYLKLTELHYAMGEAEQALNDVRECLRLDADHKKCSDHYKNLRKLTKSMERMRKAHDEQRWDECVSAAVAVINQDPSVHVYKQKGQSFVCSCQSKAKNVKEAVEACSELLKVNANDADALYYRAQVYIVDEQLDKAQPDCQKAHEIENSQRTHECIDKINKLIKQSNKKDYYKILGVKRSDDTNKIMRAYRKLAKQWHPDTFPDGPEKEKAQKTFIDIAAAKEVLTDAGINRFYQFAL